MFAQTREEVRAHFLAVWQKMATKSPLEPIEALLADVIERHPEYHALLNRPDEVLNADFSADASGVNPFLHMSLHVAIREQLQTDRPTGVVSTYRALAEQGRLEPHAIEHRMMECLSASLVEAQRKAVAPDEAAYLDCLRRAQ
ncbi:MAG: DUF1841 family protein [Gammaproteobacteria bacterium]|jgi:hypothetical protein